MTADDDRITILGGRGMLGTDLVKACRQDGFDVKIFDLPEFDITDSKQLEEVIGNTKIIINCAAYTDVDGAESKKELAYQINAKAVGRLGALVREAGAWLLHFGTDFVFDGCLERPYVETDVPNPINEYGKSKLAGEQLLSQSGCRHCIMRLEWTYGQAGQNFITKLIYHAKTKKVLKVVDDQTGSPTATIEAAKVISKLLPLKPEGVFHFASSGYVSRYGLAEFIFDKCSMNVNLLACKTSDYASAATRPLNSRFDCSKIKTLLDEPIESWQIPLERFLRQL